MDFTILRSCVRRRGGGSPTAVVDDDPAASDADRQAVPGPAGTSHAAFLSRDRRTIRFFTERRELANCGHATIPSRRGFWSTVDSRG
jgi:predicted PhzF superfamily epimerase YddE/YHI9